MIEEERNIMQQHLAYWTEKMNRGMVVVFGPIFDPKGIYGLRIVAVDNEQELTSFVEKDPATKINRYEFYPMKAIVPDTMLK